MYSSSSTSVSQDPERAVNSSPTPSGEMLSMGLAFPSPKNGAAASAKAAAKKNGGYESPINGVVSDDDDDDGGVDTDSTDDEDEGAEETEARVEISRPAMTQGRMQERFQFSRLPSTAPGCYDPQGTYFELR